MLASAWERALTQGSGGGSLGSLVRERSGVTPPPRPAPAPPPAPSTIPALPAPTPPPAPPGSVGPSVVEAASAGDNAPAVTRTKFNYPAALPPISPDVEAAFLQQRRVGTRGVEDARAYQQAGTQLAEARKLSAGQDITRQAGRGINELMATAASGGRAFSPAGVFPARRQVLAGAERQQVILEEQLAQTVQDLNRMVRDAERRQMEINAGIDMQRATLRSNAALEDLRNRQAIDMANWSAGV